MEQETIIIVSVFSAAWLVVFLMTIVLFVKVGSLRRALKEMQGTGRVRVQTLKLEDKNHAFQNPALLPDEELSRRGYSMYVPDADLESGRGTTERQTGGQFVEELTREIDHRQQRQSQPPTKPNTFHELKVDQSRYRDMDHHNDSRYREPPRQPADSRHRDFDPRQSDNNRQTTAPPFLLQAIEENKRKSRLANPVANGSGRQSDTNPNFIY